jgi:MFS family permease
MTMATFIAIYGSVALIAALLSGIVAGFFKHRDWSYWMTVTVLFPPALAILLIMPKQSGSRKRESMEAQEARQLAREEQD